MALFCVDYEIPDCLPKGNAEADPEGYLNEYCSGDAWRSVTPRATVLALDECDSITTAACVETRICPPCVKQPWR